LVVVGKAAKGPGEDAMGAAESERADQVLSRHVKGKRTVVDIGIEFTHLRRERGLSQHDLAQRTGLPLETIEAIESGRRLPTEQEFALLATGLEMTAGRLAEALRPVVDHQASGIRTWSSASDTT
jgi:DNA-binding transcriptional regulator YiaG